MTAELRLTLLRLFLLGAGGGWAATVIGVFLPWELAVDHLQTFGGAGPIPNDPMLEYWMRMAAGAFFIIGCLFLICAWKPYEYANVIPILGALNLGEGLLLLGFGSYLQLTWFPFGVDVAIGIVPGIGILYFYSVLKEDV